MKLANWSVKALYPLALAEGEGVGTAYEYVAKRLVLGRWLSDAPRPRSLLVAGLPEKYGAGLDWMVLAQEWGIRPIIVDDRPAALAHFAAAVRAAQAVGLLPGLAYDTALVSDLSALTELDGTFDLAVASEVVQRISAEKRPVYLQTIARLAARFALFLPNGDNRAHTTLSGLNGLRLAEWRILLEQRPTEESWRVGYVDLPPFPPGVTRSAEQRHQAGRGWPEALAMRGLGVYARGESFLPAALTRRYAHIIYGLGRRQAFPAAFSGG